MGLANPLSFWSGHVMRHDEQVRVIKEMCAHLDGDTNVDAGGLRAVTCSSG